MGSEEITSYKEINDWIKEYQSSVNQIVKNRLKNLIVIAFLPLVKKISYGLARRSSDPLEDLMQVGSVGLLKAIDQYDMEQGASFKTYASYFITGEIRHYLRDKCNMIRPPRELLELSFRINQIINKLTIKLDRVPTDLEIAEELQISVKKVSEISEIDRRKQILSLDQVISNSNEDKYTFADKLIDDKYQDFLNNQENRLMVIEAINSLDTPLRDVVKMTFYNDMSQSEIAKELHISQMQVSRRLKKALGYLLDLITNSNHLSNK